MLFKFTFAALDKAQVGFKPIPKFFIFEKLSLKLILQVFAYIKTRLAP